MADKSTSIPVSATLPVGVALIHSFLRAGGYVFAGTRQDPAKILRFTDIAAAEHTVLTFPEIDESKDPLLALNDGMNCAEGMVYHAGMGKVYVVLHNTSGTILSSRVIEISPEEFPDYSVIQAETDTVEFGDIDYATVLAIDEANDWLFIAFWNGHITTPIKKYSCTEKDELGHLVLLGELTIDIFGAHSMVLHDGYLYITGATMPAWVAKVDVSDMSLIELVTLPSGHDVITDDSCVANGYLWCGLEQGTKAGHVVRFDLSDLTTYEVIDTGLATACHGVFYYGGYIWALHNETTRATIVLIDPVTGTPHVYVLPGADKALNELIYDDGVFYAPTWGNDPAVLHQFEVILPSFLTAEPAVESVTGRTISLSWEAVSGAEYVVEYDTNDMFSDPEIITGISGGMCTLAGLEMSTLYHIRIRGIFDGVEHYWSDEISQRTDNYEVGIEEKRSGISAEIILPGLVSILRLVMSYVGLSPVYIVPPSSTELTRKFVIPWFAPDKALTAGFRYKYHGAYTDRLTSCPAQTHPLTEVGCSKQEKLGANACLSITSPSSDAVCYLCYSTDEDTKGIWALVVQGGDGILYDNLTEANGYDPLTTGSAYKPFLCPDGTPFGAHISISRVLPTTSQPAVICKVCLRRT